MNWYGQQFHQYQPKFKNQGNWKKEKEILQISTSRSRVKNVPAEKKKEKCTETIKTEKEKYPCKKKERKEKYPCKKEK